jgi:hypothetical protein
MTATIDHDAARELELYATNSGDLYRQQALPIIRNLAAKIVKGTYDSALAPKAWMYLAEGAAKGYSREFGPCRFSRATLAATAALLADSYAEHIADEVTDLQNARTYTVGAISNLHDEAGGFFFSRETMRFYGDTLRNFRVICEDGTVVLERRHDTAKGAKAGQRWAFDTATADLLPLDPH